VTDKDGEEISLTSFKARFRETNLVH